MAAAARLASLEFQNGFGAVATEAADNVEKSKKRKCPSG